MKTKKATTRKSTSATGRLRIGNQWNAIRIIARSQTNPLKAVCELVENAIDARAGNVHIVRRRQKGKVFLQIQDDGQGISRNDEGLPDFARIATHICDSLKRYLDHHERAGVHGEFGIGLLSFWNLGEHLQVVSSGGDGRLYEMTLGRGQQQYNVRLLRGKLDLGGTRVSVGPLLDSTRNIVTGEKLQRYLSAELRDRIRSSGVKIRILDRLARKDLLVTPREFEGERLSELANVKTGQKWRSRYDAQANEIVINSAHRDFHASRTTVAKHRRYIGKLYAKEVVLINFAHESAAEVMERLIEVLVRSEDAL